MSEMKKINYELKRIHYEDYLTKLRKSNELKIAEL